MSISALVSALVSLFTYLNLNGKKPSPAKAESLDGPRARAGSIGLKSVTLLVRKLNRALEGWIVSDPYRLKPHLEDTMKAGTGIV